MLARVFIPSGQVLLLSRFSSAFRASNLGIAFMLPGNFVAADLCAALYSLSFQFPELRNTLNRNYIFYQ